ncbi:cystathionine beta-synthase, putative [Eimeria necatrix]|uniref:cystathionine beta-synthase n=1 Tax=Eimeria necatrix TaxID=51315 RepID=U6MYY0_9EIME|nr:cystathionine beta-synthase, putative [Eimeria necatrix]CDJ67694.1 cystathionine beta-synthase, putative [Eimeria necatrix]
MEPINSRQSLDSDSAILCALATASSRREGDIEKAVFSIRRNKKDVFIPKYDSFRGQGWDDLFGDNDADMKRNGCRNGCGNHRRSKLESFSQSLESLKYISSPPAAFFQSHLARELPSILDAIGCTPLVCLSRVGTAAGVSCQLLGKCEFLSAGGSMKDRIARGMIVTAEASGRLAPGAALIEPTSGNTGIGIALVAAVKGYRSVAVMPKKMSAEKQSIMRALGSMILRTPTKAAWDDQTSHIALSIRLKEEMEDQRKEKKEDSHDCYETPKKEASDEPQIAFILDQYRNPANPISHFFGTGPELLHQCGMQLDMVVICTGTGGSLTGIGRRVKLALPNCLVVAVDPEGSILANPNEQPGKPYLVEGIGYDFVPTVLDRDVADFWVKVNDAESLLCSRLLIRLEGMLVGGSSGAALAGALKAIERMGWKDDSSKRIAMVLPDGSRNYTSKFVCDEWMVEKGFLERSELSRQYEQYSNISVQSLQLPRLTFVSSDSSLKEAAALLVQSPQPILAVVEPGVAEDATKNGTAPRQMVAGSVTQKALLMALGEMPSSAPIGEIADTETPVYNIGTPLSLLAQSLELHPFLFIESDGIIHAAVESSQLLQAFVAQKESGEH